MSNPWDGQQGPSMSQLPSTPGMTHQMTQPGYASDPEASPTGPPPSGGAVSRKMTQHGYAPTVAYTFQQPQAAMRMQANTGNRNVYELRSDTHGKRPWSHGILDCCGGGCGTCMSSSFCPCVTYGRNQKRLEHLNAYGYPDPKHGGSCCSGSCCGHACLTLTCGLGWIMQMMNRGAVRSRYSISGGGCTDCLASVFCSCCELTQERREIELEERSYNQRGQV